MSTIDQQFVEYIVKSLVSKPDSVQVERTIDEKGVLLKLTVDNEDLGRVIGKRGSTAQSIRTLLRALGTKNDARYNLKIIDPEGDNRPPREPREDRAPRDEPSAAPADDKPAEEPVADEPAEEAAVEEVVEAPVEEAQEEAPTAEGKKDSSLADKTRKELAELDDLDI
ncbi:MAG TPA: KH domain-containing protein [Candidatus Saccharimonadales bacterium]